MQFFFALFMPLEPTKKLCQGPSEVCLTSADLLPETRFWIFEGRVLHIKVTGKVLFSLRNAGCQACSREQYRRGAPVTEQLHGGPSHAQGKETADLNVQVTLIRD